MFLCEAAGPGRGRAEEAPGQRPPPPRGAAWTPTTTAGSSQVAARRAAPSGEGVGHGRARGFGGTAAGAWPEGSTEGVNCNSPVSGQRSGRCPLGAGGFVRSREWLGWFVRTVPFPCPVRAGARPVPVRFL